MFLSLKTTASTSYLRPDRFEIKDKVELAEDFHHCFRQINDNPTWLAALSTDDGILAAQASKPFQNIECRPLRRAEALPQHYNITSHRCLLVAIILRISVAHGKMLALEQRLDSSEHAAPDLIFGLISINDNMRLVAKKLPVPFAHARMKIELLAIKMR